MPKHKNIVQFVDFIESDQRYYLIMELALGGNLKKFIKKRNGKPIDEKEILIIFK